MKIIISPWSKDLMNGGTNPKNYPYWDDVVKLLRQNKHYVIQIGRSHEKLLDVDGYKMDLPLKNLKELVNLSDTWISIDNFFPHFCSHLNKPGVVIFGKSDPNIFGYKNNINLLQSRSFLRKQQFEWWESETFNKNVFVDPMVVYNAVSKLSPKHMI